MKNNGPARLITLTLLCVLAAGINHLLYSFFVVFLNAPLYLDTVFTAAVSFAAGPVPGLVVVLLTGFLSFLGTGSFNPFILCNVAEVFIICALNPLHFQKQFLQHVVAREAMIASFVRVLGGLMLLYIACCMAVSLLGGLIDFFYFKVLLHPKEYFSAEDTLKIGLLQTGLSPLPIDILSRFPVNMVDRFIVIFGGYFISRGVVRLRGDVSHS